MPIRPSIFGIALYCYYKGTEGKLAFTSSYMDWLVGCFGLNGPFRQSFSLWAVFLTSQAFKWP